MVFCKGKVDFSSVIKC